MDRIEIKKSDFPFKYYLNGFPKSGLHWVALMLNPVAKPLVDLDSDLWDKPWAGLFEDASWSTNRRALEWFLYKVSRLTDGHYLQGHCGYDVEVDKYMWFSGISHVFIYRDLRDVVVSQAYHVVSEEDRFVHLDKDLYRALGSHEEVMKAVITGIDKYPGLFERWELFAPWVSRTWVHKVKFEDLRSDPHKAAAEILRYGLVRVASIFGCKQNIIEENFDFMVNEMVTNSTRTGQSATFRKGNVGDWQTEFTPEVTRLFKKADKDNWLERLGYEW